MSADELMAEGWTPVASGRLPPVDQVVEWARDSRVHHQEPFFARWQDFRPEFNVAGLWWRPA